MNLAVLPNFTLKIQYALDHAYLEVRIPHSKLAPLRLSSFDKGAMDTSQDIVHPRTVLWSHSSDVRLFPHPTQSHSLTVRCADVSSEVRAELDDL